MIDLHCHVLPGIDDGPDTIEDSLALARAAASAGTRVMVATPHVSWEYQNDAATITKLARELNARLAQDGVALEVLVGAEIAMTRAADIEAVILHVQRTVAERAACPRPRTVARPLDFHAGSVDVTGDGARIER